MDTVAHPHGFKDTMGGCGSGSAVGCSLNTRFGVQSTCGKVMFPPLGKNLAALKRKEKDKSSLSSFYILSSTDVSREPAAVAFLFFYFLYIIFYSSIKMLLWLSRLPASSAHKSLDELNLVEKLLQNNILSIVLP